MSADHTTSQPPQPITYGLAELAERSGVAARTIRFYTTEGLLEAPGKAGRQAVYTAQHLVTLELIRELQSHGFGLAAIKEHLNRIADDAAPESIALHSTKLAPWLANRPETITRHQLDERTERPLTDDEITMLANLGIIKDLGTQDGTQRYEVATALLSIAVELIDFGLTPESSAEIARLIDEAGLQLTENLEDTYTRMLRPKLSAQKMTDTDVERFVALFKPVSIAAVTRSYEQAVNDLRTRESEATQDRQRARAASHNTDQSASQPPPQGA